MYMALRVSVQHEACFCTAGSRLLCMVYEKYVMDLGWHIELFPLCKAALPQPDAPQDKGTVAALVMLHSLAAWLQVSFILSFSMILLPLQRTCLKRSCCHIFHLEALWRNWPSVLPND